MDISKISKIKAAFLPEEVIAKGRRVSVHIEDAAGPGSLQPLGEVFSREAHCWEPLSDVRVLSNTSKIFNIWRDDCFI